MTLDITQCRDTPRFIFIFVYAFFLFLNSSFHVHLQLYTVSDDVCTLDFPVMPFDSRSCYGFFLSLPFGLGFYIR